MRVADDVRMLRPKHKPRPEIELDQYVCGLLFAGHEALLQTMSALKRLAIVLLRVADDVRMLASVHVYVYVQVVVFTFTQKIYRRARSASSSNERVEATRNRTRVNLDDVMILARVYVYICI